MKWRIPTALLIAGVMLPTGGSGVIAQTNCAPRHQVVQYLGQAFGENPAAFAITDLAALLEVLVSPGGSWTMIVTTAKGLACVVATGKDWQLLEKSKSEPAV